MAGKISPYYHDLYDVLGEPGCPFCRLLDKEAERLIEAVLWESVNDVKTRERFNHARGYCHPHTWLLMRGGAALGTSFLMQGLLKKLMDIVEENDPAEGARFSLGQLWPNGQKKTQLKETLSPQEECPVCARLAILEDHYSKTLLKYMTGPHALTERYQESAGLCLPHFRATIGRASGWKSLSALVAAQQVIWQRLHAELSEFIRKNDYRYIQTETFGSEEDAWLRALEAAAGSAPPDTGSRKGLTQTR